MGFDFRKLFFRLLTVTVTAAAAFPAAYACYQMHQGMQNGSRGLVLGGGFHLLAGLYFFGLCCAWQYSRSSAESFTDFCLYPKRYLKSPPVILSRQQGLIAAGNYQEAEIELMNLRESTPSSPEITWLLADLHAECLHDVEAAAADYQYYFIHRKWRRHELNLPILLRCIDFLCQLGKTQEACRRLQKESNSSLYSSSERKAISLRLASLRAREQFPEK